MTLYVVSTPIGNLGEFSDRAKTILSEADIILCEDTRRTRRLLTASGISAKLITCNSHNEVARTQMVLETLMSGDTVALVSDAGAPAISDPGGRVVESVHRSGHPVRVVGGPSSITAALSVSGFPASPFHFLGFPPRKNGPRRKWLAEVSRFPGTLVVLESGQRVGGLISAMADCLPDREACVCREMTKLHEEIIRGPIGLLPTGTMKGEVVLVVGPGQAVKSVEETPIGEGLSEIAKALAKRWNVGKADVYRQLIALESAKDDQSN